MATTPKKYKTYSFQGQDPMVVKVLSLVDGLTYASISRDSGISTTTLSNWKHRRTKRPQHCTMAATLGAAGYEFTIAKRKLR